jgi:hypothetical protein
MYADFLKIAQEITEEYSKKHKVNLLHKKELDIAIADAIEKADGYAWKAGYDDALVDEGN